MMNTISAKDFRLRFKEMCDKVQNGESFVVFRRSKPVFKVVPANEGNSDLLDMASSVSAKPVSLKDINDIVHRIRQEVD